jgi:macrodomain Ter protein organizer (MatP/YcbG family)
MTNGIRLLQKGLKPLSGLYYTSIQPALIRALNTLKNHRFTIRFSDLSRNFTQKNYIACAILVWLRLKTLAYKSGQTIYQIKHGLLSNYLVQQLKRPDVPMSLL